MYKDFGPYREETFLELEETRQDRIIFEGKVNRKMEPIERLAATNLDPEASLAQKRQVPLVLLIIVLRIVLLVLDCARMSIWYPHHMIVTPCALLILGALLVEQRVAKTAQGITFESVKTRQVISPTFSSDWEFIIGICCFVISNAQI